MFLIVGLGNPDKKYEKTRHNIGFDTIDALAEQYHITMNDHKHKALCGTGVIEGVKVLLAKPLTYMNLSGDSVAEIVNFYKLDPESEMIVIFDDISLAPGIMRIKVGVGEKPQCWDLADHVLGRFSTEDRVLVEDAIRDACSAAVLMMQGDVDAAMNHFNAKKQG